MYQIEFNIKHGNSDKFVDNFIIEVSNISEMKQEFLLAVLNSYDNALNQISRKVYPDNKPNMQLEFVSSNFLKSKEEINNFLINGQKNIEDNSNGSKKRKRFFEKKHIKIKEDYLFGSLDYSQLEKAKSKRKSKINRWQKEKKEFLESVEKTKKQLMKPKK